MASTIMAWVDDLFFLAKILETARRVGVTVVQGDSRSGLAGVIKAQPRALIVDLNSRPLPAVDRIRELKADPSTSSLPIVAFVSHVQEQLITAAREAGCDKVMARSAFTQQLPEMLRTLAGSSDT